MELRKLSTENVEEIEVFFADVFTNEPWNDDWSDKEQLHAYILDLAGNATSLTYGLYDEEELIGLSIGNVKHWCEGTEYYIDEFCISRDRQGCGLGGLFLKKIELEIKQLNIKAIFLQTERTVPAYEFYLKHGFFNLKDHVSLLKIIK